MKESHSKYNELYATLAFKIDTYSAGKYIFASEKFRSPSSFYKMPPVSLVLIQLNAIHICIPILI
jgi:hypothetical protein